MEVLHDEVYESYKEELIMELQSNEVDDMQKNMTAVA
jgi:hypothetical protein